MARARNTSRRSLVSRLKGRGNRRRRPEGAIRRHAWRGAVAASSLAALIAGVGWAGPSAWVAIRAHDYFVLRDIVVERRGRMSEEAILAAARVRKGMSIWDVDAARVEGALERLPWVRSARVRRELPRRVVLRVREHRPAAIVHLPGVAQPLHYVSASGRVFAPVGLHDGRDFPYVTGFDRDAVQSGTAASGLRAAMLTLRTAARYQDALGTISEVHVDATGELTLLPARPAVPILLGAGDVDATLARVAAVLPGWREFEDTIHSLRGDVDGQVIVRLRAVPKEWGA